jgi:putative MFS transporter
MRAVSFETALERVGYGRFQRRLLVICGLGWAADAMEVLLVSFALPAMSAEWGLSTGQKSLLATAIFLGMFAGAVFWGRLSDRIGRRLGFILTIAFDSLFGLLSAFSPSFGVFLLLRVFNRLWRRRNASGGLRDVRRIPAGEKTRLAPGDP